MSIARAFLLSAALAATALAQPALAKGRIEAIVLTPIRADAAPGTALEIDWVLQDPKNDTPFNARTAVFIRLIGRDGTSSEAIASRGAPRNGEYGAAVTVPPGGVVSVEIGIQGTANYPDGRRERSDWLMELTNDPIG